MEEVPPYFERSYSLIKDSIRILELDLAELSILTEMGSGPYLLTPFIAALAGSKNVLVVTKDSPYGKREEILSLGMRLAKQWDVDGRIKILNGLTPTEINKADIVTNLGFVRPIDSEFISHLKPGSVIPYMREAWETRSTDVDLAACKRYSIPVLGTNESYEDLQTFNYCGPLALKLLLNSGLEVFRCNIGILSGDKFGDVIERYLCSCGANVWRAKNRKEIKLSNGNRLDALLVAYFLTDDQIIGEQGWITPALLKHTNPECRVVVLVGSVDTPGLIQAGIQCIPSHQVKPRRMTKTLAELGPKPVIDLHAAGLKVGELMWRKMKSIGNADDVERILSSENSLTQRIHNPKNMMNRNS